MHTVPTTQLRRWWERLRSAVLALLFLVGAPAGASAQLSSQLSSNLVAHWALDEGGGLVASDATGAHDGTLVKGVTWTPGVIGSAVDLDGTSGYIAVPPSLDLGGEGFTIAAWVKVRSRPTSADQPRVISKATSTDEQRHEWMVSLVESAGQSRLRFRVRAGGRTTTLVASSGNLSLHTWHHVAATYDGAAMRLYLDGVEVGAVAKSGTVARNSTVPVNIGRNPDGTNYLHGAIDDVRLYGHALSGPDISRLAGTSAAEPEFVAHWAFDEGAGGSALDATGTYHGTLVKGMNWGPGVVGSALEFDGASGYVDLPSFDLPRAGFTIAAWVKAYSPPGSRIQPRIISKATGTLDQSHHWLLNLVESAGRTRLRFRLRTDGYTTTLIASSGDVSLHTWHHVAATYDGAAMRLYLDGREVGAVAKSGPVAASSLVPVNIGRNPDGSNHLHGAIDDLRIYRRALSAADIRLAAESAAVQPAPIQLAAPMNLIATRVTASEVDLAWEPGAGGSSVAGYRVFRDGIAIATSSRATYSDSGLASATTFRYWVTAYDASGNESPPSPAISVTTLALPQQIPVDLVAHWAFDEGAGAAALDTTGVYHGTLVNGVTWGTGFTGSAIELDGRSGYVAVPSLDVAGEGLTIAAWVKIRSRPTSSIQPRIISKATTTDIQNHEWMVSLVESAGQSRVRFRLRTGGHTTNLVASSGDLSLHTWHHVTATYDGKAMRLYLDGMEVGATAKSGPVVPDSTVPVNIGRNPDGKNYLHGSLDDVRVYSRALSAVEVGALGTWALPISGNRPPDVSLLEPVHGATYTAPATITVRAAASDADGSVTRVDFYAGSQLIGTDATSPYEMTWTGVPPGTYALVAVAHDDGGAMTVSGERTVSVHDPALPGRAIFSASPDHGAVDRYLLEVFAEGADPTRASPVASKDLGKPVVVGGECEADIRDLIAALPPGQYIATVSAFAGHLSSRSAPSASFAR